MITQNPQWGSPSRILGHVCRYLKKYVGTGIISSAQSRKNICKHIKFIISVTLVLRFREQYRTSDARFFKESDGKSGQIPLIDSALRCHFTGIVISVEDSSRSLVTLLISQLSQTLRSRWRDRSSPSEPDTHLINTCCGNTYIKFIICIRRS